MAPTDAVEPLADTPERPIIDLRATLGRGDGFARVLERAGVAAAEADQVAALIAEACRSTTSARHGDRPHARPPPEPHGRPPARRARASAPASTSGSSSSGSNGELALTRIPIAVDDTPLRIQGRVGASLYRSARAAGVPARAVEAYIRALASQISIPSGSARTTASTSSSSIAAPRPARPRPAAALCRARPLPGRDLQMMQWEQRRPRQWFEASGVGRQSGGSSSRCRARSPPISACACTRSSAMRGCTAASISAPATARRSSPRPTARCRRAGWAGGYGNQVRLAHAGGLATSYSHMSRIVGRAGHPRPPGPGDRLCRLDRPLDRPAPPLRDLPQRRDDQPALGQLRQPRPAVAAASSPTSAAGCATCSAPASARFTPSRPALRNERDPRTAP